MLFERTMTIIAPHELADVTGGGPGSIVRRRYVDSNGQLVAKIYDLGRALDRGLDHVGVIKRPDGGWTKIFSRY